jgi:hypothetical protein
MGKCVPAPRRAHPERSAAVANTVRLVGSIIYWAAIGLAVFGIISTIMSVALYDGDERLWATVNWAVFTVAAWIVGFAVRKALLK